MKINLKTEHFKKTKIINHCLIVVSVIFVVMVISSCVTTAPQTSEIIVSGNNPSCRMNSVLDIKFVQVTLRRMRIVRALSLLTKAIANAPGKRPYFNWEIEPVPASTKGITQKENRLVKINQTNTTLRQVLDDLCAQTGWRYEECAIGILFIAPTNWVKGK